MRKQRGNTLLIFLALFMSMFAYFAVSSLTAQKNEINQANALALGQAKMALVGFAATYRDRNPGEMFGYLPCPDTDNDGVSNTPCGAAGVTSIGRLPWKTLGLPPLKDSVGECLWYIVSGNATDNPKTQPFNWDTVGQLIVRQDGMNVVPTDPHDAPWALVLAPGEKLQSLGQANQIPASSPFCSGTAASLATDYLEGTATTLTNGVVEVASSVSVKAGTNNDLWISVLPKDIFDRIAKRTGFGTDIVDTLTRRIELCANNLPSSGFLSGPPSVTTDKGALQLSSLLTSCPSVTSSKAWLNWQDNLLYVKPTSPVSINGKSCNALLHFGGARQTGKYRNAAQAANPANYLEAAAIGARAGNADNSAVTAYSTQTPTQDLTRCLVGLPSGASQFSFSNDLANFGVAGKGASKNITATATASENSLTITADDPITGGCAWYPQPITVATKTVRAYFSYRLKYGNHPIWLSTTTYSAGDVVVRNNRAYTSLQSGNKGNQPESSVAWWSRGVVEYDRGYGFTFQFVRNDLGSPNAQGVCGRTQDMGALAISSSGAAQSFGQTSLTMESDVYYNAGDDESSGLPVGNHVAITAFGNLAHSPSNGNPTASCDGTSGGCSFTPSNYLEDVPTTMQHNQRIEIKTGCLAGCTDCLPIKHGTRINKPDGTPELDKDRKEQWRNFAKIRVWVDCKGSACEDVTQDFAAPSSCMRTSLPQTYSPSPNVPVSCNSAYAPNMERCEDLQSSARFDNRLNTAYWGFTGGFRSSPVSAIQGVEIRDFVIRSE